MYYSYNTGSYDSQSAPNTGGWTARLYGSNWYDSGSYAVILSYSSTSIRVRLYRGNNKDLQNVFRMTFRFYTERLTPSGCNGVTIQSNRYGTNFRSLNDYGTYSRHFYATYSYLTNGNMYWPYWYANEYLDFTFSFSSVSGDVNNGADQMFVTATV